MARYMSAARMYYQSLVMPREDRDLNAERRHFIEHGEHVMIYKKLKLNEPGGRPFRLIGSIFALNKFAAFGLGIGLYFYALVAFVVISIIGGLILLPVIFDFMHTRYGIAEHDTRLGGTAACPQAVEVEALCDDHTCTALYREGCEYPGLSAVCADLAMCLFIALALFIWGVLSSRLETELDAKVQTTQDYSLVVNNPPEDASDPDEWCDFFKRFGMVRYVTVVRDNSRLLKLLLQKRLVVRQIGSLIDDFRELDAKAAAVSSLDPSIGNYLCWSCGFRKSSDEYFLRRLADLNEQIKKDCQSVFPVCRVFVTFELEDAKQLAVHSLQQENSFWASITRGSQHRMRFRGQHVLHAEESSEQSNVLWLNSAIKSKERVLRRIGVLIIFALLLWASFELLSAAHGNALYLLLSISALDNAFPVVIAYLASLEGPLDEDNRQDNLMSKLFVSRLLTSTIMPFLSIPWDQFLDGQTLVQIINVQLISCFVTPFIKLLDPKSVLYKYILTPLLAKNQADANRLWSGTPFTLAERYTEVAKIMFISLFYSALVPTSLFIAAVAFINLFLIDRYLLLRTACPPPKLDNSMGPTLAKQVAVAAVIKILLSYYFVYSWPMDEVYTNSSGDKIKVNKVPDKPFWRFERQFWHDKDHWFAIELYGYCFYFVVAVCLLVFSFKLLTKIADLFLPPPTLQCLNQTPFSTVESTEAYCPVVAYDPETFVAADTRFMLRRHRPETVDLYDAVKDDGEFNLSDYLSPRDVGACMSQVKWFGDPEYPGVSAEPVPIAAKTEISVNPESIDLELGISLTTKKRRQQKSQVLPTNDVLSDMQVGNKIKFSSEERTLLKKIRAELRKNNMMSKLHKRPATDEPQLVDFNKFQETIFEYCPSILAPVQFIYPDENNDLNFSSAAQQNRKTRMQLRLLFVKVLSLQNSNFTSEEKRTDKVDISSFFRAVAANVNIQQINW